VAKRSSTVQERDNDLWPAVVATWPCLTKAAPGSESVALPPFHGGGPPAGISGVVPSVSRSPDVWPDGLPGGGLRRSVFLPAEVSSARLARVTVVVALADWRLSAAIDDVSACVSELVANACVHAGGTPGSLRLSLHISGRYLSAHVRDGSPRPPVARYRPELGEDNEPTGVDGMPESGFGLCIVDALSDGWCWWPVQVGRQVGKVVTCWFALDRPFDRLMAATASSGEGRQ
jgi:anti-sigma regulatory factor (Ser/Thr protein kinase)